MEPIEGQWLEQASPVPDFGYLRILSISPIFPSGCRILCFVKGTHGKVCSLWKNEENGIGEHGCLIAFLSRFSPIPPPPSPASLPLVEVVNTISIVIL